VKKCPFDAISIINIPKNLESQTTHRYGPNSFKLHRLPTPRVNQVLGLVGTNGIGKSTALKILANKLKPNLGRFDNPPDWQEVITYYRGSELQNYLTKLLEDNIKAIIKPQYVDAIPKMIEGSVRDILTRKDDRKVFDNIIVECDLAHLLEKPIAKLSGGELQRFAIAIACVQEANIYMFDEPSSYLDVKQRLQAARSIRAMCADAKYVVAVEHDLSVLDYLSDYVCCLYGRASAYGVVTMPYSVREGINIFLDGFIPTENMRFRDIQLTFKVSENFSHEELARRHGTPYPKMAKTLTSNHKGIESSFHLDIEAGQFSESEIIVLLGQNGTGKTTFIRMLAGLEKANEGAEVPPLSVSYKPQKIAPQFPGSVRELLTAKIAPAMHNSQFQSDVMRPMKIDDIIDQKVKTLSGGELQRVALVLSLGIPADIYLIDEPSAYLDSEQRLIAARVIKRYILHAKKTAFIVEHDFIMSTYLADRVIVYEGEPGKKARANSPQTLVSGMNKFLAELNISFRRDPSNHRPRINKLNSQKDQEQKKAGNYFFIDTDNEKDALDKADKAAQKAAEKGAAKAAAGKKGKK
jgi:ATP-binding cassette subfamily E protein 1